MLPSAKLTMDVAVFVAQHKKIARMLSARDKDVDTVGTKIVSSYQHTDQMGVLHYEVVFEFTTQPDKEQNDDIKVMVHVQADKDPVIAEIQTY